ncbi:MAG: hypothetical protein K8R11_03445 [Methanococcoides sp.]|nr:hypothetical protein [Methanococcoides sp.]
MDRIPIDRSKTYQKPILAPKQFKQQRTIEAFSMHSHPTASTPGTYPKDM